ncbi:MAG: CBS domain-containing protein [Actinomycetota bacterium]|nr:CBS domain-containing protein [Actinomycetota bacterium]
MSPRAAWRLEGLGFEDVYDYVPGKADWSASGLPTEGTLAGVLKIGDAARRDVPTCSPAEKVGAARERVRKAGWDRCAVVSKQRVVLGLLREKELDADAEATAEEAMRNGPATFRPDEPVENMAKRMRERGARTVLVTTSDGRLVGLLYREDAERLAVEQVGGNLGQSFA